MTTQLSDAHVGSIGGLMVFAEFVVEGIKRRHGEVLPLEGNVTGLIRSQLAQYITKAQAKGVVKCTEKIGEEEDGSSVLCGRRFIDEATLKAHAGWEHNPEMQAMQDAVAGTAEPEPGPQDDVGSRKDASGILPTGVTGTQQLAGRTGEPSEEE